MSIHLQNALHGFFERHYGNLPTKVERGSAYSVSQGLTLDVPLLWQEVPRAAIKTFGSGNEAALKATEDELVMVITEGEVIHSFVTAGTFNDFAFHIKRGQIELYLLIRPRR